MVIKAAYSFPSKSSSSNRRDRQASSGSNDPFHYDTVITSGDRNKELPSQPTENTHNSSDALANTTATLFEYVQALHDYSAQASGSNVCLSFQAGQVIKVLSRDVSGWWDGELEGRRGWFPSNYVAVTAAPASASSLHLPQQQQASTSMGSESMRRAASSPASTVFASTSTSSTSQNSSTTSLFGPRPDSPPFDSSRIPQANEGITASIIHAISLLENAVHNKRYSHYGPAATCLIASVRSVLSATDCLARESVILRTHLNLSRLRKQILSNLASLVTKARDISTATSTIMSEIMRVEEEKEMLEMAHNVLGAVEHFLETAVKCGVHVPSSVLDTAGSPHQHQQNASSTSSLSVAENHLQVSQLLRLEDISTPNLDACLQFFPSTSANADIADFATFPASSSSSASQTKGPQKTKSLADVKSRRKASEASNASSGGSSSHGSQGSITRQHYSPPPQHAGLPQKASTAGAAGAANQPGLPRNAAQQAAMLRRPSMPAVYTTSTLPAPLLPSQQQPAWQANDSISSVASSVVSQTSSPRSMTPASSSLNAPQLPVEVYRMLSNIHDTLLSTIAALIGHVHAHSRSSHSSSYAHLIDMTRETIERVREILHIVDIVLNLPAVQAQSSTSSLKSLHKYRESLYLSTTSLVNAARKATGPIDENDIDTKDQTALHDLEEEEKEQLLKAATSVLRASADVVNATKPILLKRGLDNVTIVIDFGQREQGQQQLQQQVGIPNSESTLTEVMMSRESSRDEQDSTLLNEDSGTGMASTDDATTSSNMGSGDDKATQGASLLSFGKEAANSTGVQKRSSKETGRVAEWQRQQQEERRSRTSLDTNGLPRHTQSARNSLLLSSSTTSQNSSSFASAVQEEAVAAQERSQSSLSMRRGVPIPANLQLQQPKAPRHVRTPSFGSMSATSTVTSLREKAATPAPTLRAIISHQQPVQQQQTPVSATSFASATSSRAGGEAMSRDESSRGSATSTATSTFRSVFSEQASTADTSPRSSVFLSSPAEEKVDWQNQQLQLQHVEPPSASSLSFGKPGRPGFLRARSGSTPDRLTALRISEFGSSVQAPLPSPLSPRLPPIPSSPLESQTSGGRAWILERDYETRECEFSSDGNVRSATFKCLIERLTLHDQTIDPVFANTFFLTFRIFSTPHELTEALIDRYNITASSTLPMSESEAQLWHDKKLIPVRLRVYNSFKTWLESHWKPESDNAILDRLLSFTRETMAASMAAPAQRLVDLIQKRSLLSGSGPTGRPRGLTRMASAEKLKAGKPINDGLGSATFPSYHSSLPPSPIVSKALFAMLRTHPYAPSSIADIDPLELARQFTIMESRLYCAILPEELIGQEFGKKSNNKISNVRMMSSLSTRITGWIAEIILSEQDAKKRTSLVKYFIKLGDRCHSLQNYNTLMAILAALNSSTISRLKKTWEGLSNKYKTILETLRRSTEHARNYAEYRATIRSAVAPCLPFLGLYLTDVTFCYDGNPSHRPSPVDASLKLINFDRYQKIAKYVGDLQRFQQPYNLVEVPEIQSFLHSALANVENGGDVHALYRRSLMVEPREGAAEQQPVYASTAGKDLFNWKMHQAPSSLGIV